MRKGNVFTGVYLLTGGSGVSQASGTRSFPRGRGGTLSPVTGPVQSPVPGPARGEAGGMYPSQVLGWVPPD